MFLDFVHCLMFLKKNKFQKVDLFTSSCKIMAAPTLLGPLQRASLDHWSHKDPNNRVGAGSVLPEEGNRSSFRNIAFS
jgi:hypothetical protein